MKKIHPVLFFISIFIYTPFLVEAQVSSNSDNSAIDQIVAVVNDHIILESEVDQQVRQYLYQMQRREQNVSFSDRMWYTVLNNMVEQFVLLDHAKIDSVTVTDQQIDRRINQRIQQITQQLGSEEALVRQTGRSIIELRADLREQYQRDLIIQQYRQLKVDDIQITRPEVEAFYKTIPADSLPTVPEQVAVSQIVAIPSPNQQAREEALQLAKTLRDSVVNHGKSIEVLARRYSDGPAAANAGKLPMMAIDDLVPPYAAAASVLEPGEISEVVETEFGFHVIRLNKRQGEQIDTNHILIGIDDESYDEQATIEKLKQIRDSVMSNPEITFAEKAREKSEDPNTAAQGGQLLQPQTGERLLALQQLDPSLYRIVLVLEEGEISEPKPFNIGTSGNTQPAYRIVRLDEQNDEHTATLSTDYELIKQFALREKRYKAVRKWITKLKEEVYINYKIPIPSWYDQTAGRKSELQNQQIPREL